MDKYNELQTVLKNKEKVLIIGPMVLVSRLLLQNLENIMILKFVT